MARIDYASFVGQTFTNNRKQNYLIIAYRYEDRKHRFDVQFVDKNGVFQKNKLGELKILKDLKMSQVINEDKSKLCKYFEPKDKSHLKGMKDKIVMGIDGSTNCTGYTIRHGCRVLKHDQIQPPKGLETDQKIDYMAKEVAKIAEQYKVELAFYEEPDNENRNVPLWELQGVVRNKVLTIPFERIPPSPWKSASGFTMSKPRGVKLPDNWLRDKQKEESKERATRLMGYPMREDESDAFNMLDYCMTLEKKED